MRVLVLLFLLCPAMVMAKSWSDLDEGETAIYGSEKEKKMPINAFFVEREKWEGHSSLSIFWLFKTTDYRRYTSLRVLPFYYNQTSKIDDRSRSFLPIFLTYYSKIDTRNFLVSPLYFNSSSPSHYDRSLGYLFWWGKQDSDDSAHSYLFSPLLNYETRPRGYVLWFPVVPLTYHAKNTGGGHRNFFWLLDYAWKTNENNENLYRFWFLPLFIWGKSQSDGYLASLLFSYRTHSNEANVKTTSFSFPLLPLYSHHYVNNQLQSRWFFPIFSYSAGEEKKTILTPIFYFNRNQQEKVVYSILYGSESINRTDHTESSFWLPGLPLYAQRYENEIIKQQWLLPIWYRSKGETYSTFYSLLFNTTTFQTNRSTWIPLLPVYFWSRSEDATWNDTLSWFLPLYYREQAHYENSRHNSLYTLLWANTQSEYDSGKKYSAFWFPLIPLYYRDHDGDFRHTNVLWIADYTSYQNNAHSFWLIPFWFWKKNSYLVVAPFYVSTPQPENTTKHYGLFHYYHRTPEFKTMWILPYFSSTSEVSPNAITLLLPVWLNYKNENWQSEIIVPWSLYYGDKDYQLYLHISGISQRANVTRVASADPSKSDAVYLDTDFSWLYNMFSISARTDVVALNNDAQPPKENSAAEKPAAPAIVHRKEFNREHSESFFGFQLFYGLAAWEKADTRRHFRLLPLSWLTWDTASADRLSAFPPVYFSYLSEIENISYLAIVPFYGKQTSGKSHREAWLLTTYWHEYDEKENRFESDIFWPVVNWHNSDKASGFRILPFFYQKRRHENNMLYEQKISPVFYFAKEEPSPQPAARPDSSANDTTTQNEPKANASPYTHLNILALYDHIWRENYQRVWLFPFYYYESTATHSTKFLLGYYSRRAHGNPAGLTLAPPFYINFHNAGRSTSLYGLWLWWHESDSEKKYTEHTLLWPLVNWYNSENTQGSRFFPFYLHSKSIFHSHLNVLLMYDSYNSSDKSSLWITPLFYRGRSAEEFTNFTLGYYHSRDPHNRRDNFLFLYDQRTGNDLFINGLLFHLLHFRHGGTDRRMHFLYTLGFDYHYSAANDFYDFSLGLFLVGAQKNEFSRGHSVFPLYSYTRYETSFSLWSIAGLSYFNHEEEHQFSLGLLGIAYFRNKYPETDLHMVLGGTLWHERRWPERKYHSRGMLWGILWDYETEEETGFSKFTILKGFYKKITDADGSRQKFLWIF